MIFYFSGTGNTKWVAQRIAEALNETLISIPDLIREGQYQFTLQAEERIGFCFPTHGWQPPRIVRDFIHSLKLVGIGPNTFCWALTTCGDNMGDCMTIFNKELRMIGLEAETLFSVVMPESYVCLPFMYTDTAEKEVWKIENARRQTAHIISIIKDRKRGIEELEHGATPRLYSYVLGAYFNKYMITDRKFQVDADACIQCGKCAQVCPVENISGTPPTWLHNDTCTCCLACYHHCPTHAINYGSITRSRRQYYFGHPSSGRKSKP